MAVDQIESLANAHGLRIANEIEAAFEEYLDGIDAAQLAISLDDIDANHIRAQLAAQLDLNESGQPAPVLDLLTVALLALASFAGAVTAHAAAQGRHTVNPRSTEIIAVRDAAPDFARRFLGEVARGMRAAIETAIYSPGNVDRRAALLKQSIGLSERQVRSLETMHDALMQFVSAPVRRLPARTDANGVRQTATIARVADVRAILASTRGHISGAQRNMLAKAMGNPKLTEAGAIAILDRHAVAMRSFRIRAVAGEGIHALAETAKLAGWQIAQGVGALPSDQRRFWHTAGDERVRHAHAQVPGMNAQGVALREAFDTPLGPAMVPPLEYGCRCRAQLRGAR